MSDTDLSFCNVVVTGGTGFVGCAVCDVLAARGCRAVHTLGSDDYDLMNMDAVAAMYRDLHPEVIVHLAARVGGIGANMERPGEFFYGNLTMGLNLIEQGRIVGLWKFVHVGTVCSYPKLTPVPFREDDLWGGYPEETNAPYGIAKKTLGVMLDAYHRQYGMKSAYVIPVNLYGPGDNFDPASSHVIPAMIRKFCRAVDRGERSVTLWGTGAATREFLYVDDAAEAIVRAAERVEEPTPINLGTGRDITIYDLAHAVAGGCGYEGEIEWDISKPDGQPRRCLDTSKAHKLLDWQASTPLIEGLRATAAWYRANHESARDCVPMAA